MCAGVSERTGGALLDGGPHGGGVQTSHHNRLAGRHSSAELCVCCPTS